MSTSDSLRRGWTTGACATAATRSACAALYSGEFLDPVSIDLPGDLHPSFVLATESSGDGWATAGIIKDAGDDPDVTHGALIEVTVSRGSPGSGVVFAAGPGVGTVTKPGLPLAVGEPAINPVPRRMMSEVVAQLAAVHGESGDARIEIGVAHGEEIATHTWNPRLGIVGGLSILGTTGVVIPYSCSAWIASIHRGIDVARASGLKHIAGATGSTSEAAVRDLHRLPLEALIDMGDFAGGMLKYLRRRPVERVTIAGGFAKMSKLAVGHLDLHSGRSAVDLDWLAARLGDLGAAPELVIEARLANSALHVLQLAAASVDPSLARRLAEVVATAARATAVDVLRGAPTDLDTVVVSRTGEILAHAPT